MKTNFTKAAWGLVPDEILVPYSHIIVAGTSTKPEGYVRMAVSCLQDGIVMWRFETIASEIAPDTVAIGGMRGRLDSSSYDTMKFTPEYLGKLRVTYEFKGLKVWSEALPWSPNRCVGIDVESAGVIQLDAARPKFGDET